MLNLFGKKPERENNEFCVVVNRADLYEAAKKKGNRHVMLMRGRELSASELQQIKSKYRAIAMVLYDEEDEQLKNRLRQQACREEIDAYIERFPLPENGYVKSTDIEFGFLDGHELTCLKDLCDFFPGPDYFRRELISFGYILSTDYTNRCGNCHERMSEEDKYCQYCGAKRGEGKFLPFNNASYCLYGPPVTKKYTCAGCGFHWEDFSLGGIYTAGYCPQCGKDALTIEEEDDWDRMSANKPATDDEITETVE